MFSGYESLLWQHMVTCESVIIFESTSDCSFSCSANPYDANNAARCLQFSSIQDFLKLPRSMREDFKNKNGRNVSEEVPGITIIKYVANSAL